MVSKDLESLGSLKTLYPMSHVGSVEGHDPTNYLMPSDMGV